MFEFSFCETVRSIPAKISTSISVDGFSHKDVELIEIAVFTEEVEVCGSSVCNTVLGKSACTVSTISDGYLTRSVKWLLSMATGIG